MSQLTLVRRACVGTLATGLAALTLAAPASAESVDLNYTCALFTVDIPGEFDPEALEEKLTEELDQGESLKDAAREAIPEVEKADPTAKAAPTSTDKPAADEPGDDEADEPGDDEEPPFPDITPIAENLPLTARFDTAIADGATTPLGKDVSLEPASARFTLSTELTDELGALSIGTGLGGAYVYGGVVESDQPIGIEFDLDTFGLGKGPVTLDGTSSFADEEVAVTKAGTYTYAAGDLDFFFIDEETLTVAGLECTLDEGQDPTVDQVTAKAATTPTTPTTPAPERPVVVQTDAAQPTSPSWLPLTAAGLASILVLGGATRFATRRAARD